MSVIFSTGLHSLQDESEPVYLDHQGHTATIVLNRPGKLNAITSSMWKRLYQAITTLSANDSLRWYRHQKFMSKSLFAWLRY